MNSSAPGSQAHPHSLRVVLVDDHQVTRCACRALLRTQGVEVVADLGSGERAVAAVRGHSPDVAVVDVTPGDDAGLELARRLRELPGAPTVILTSSAHSSLLRSSIEGVPFIAKADISKEAILEARLSDSSR